MTDTHLQIIVQAGGRGSRLRHHTWNKPKCLVSVLGKPLIYHLFDRYPHAKFIIIGDYAFDQLEKYLKINPPSIEFELIHTESKNNLLLVFQIQLITSLAQLIFHIPLKSKVNTFHF